MKLKTSGTLDSQPVENVELEDEELVINKESTKHFKNELEQINNAGNALRDSKGTPQESSQMSRLQKLKKKKKIRQRWTCKSQERRAICTKGCLSKQGISKTLSKLL